MITKNILNNKEAYTPLINALTLDDLNPLVCKKNPKKLTANKSRLAMNKKLIANPWDSKKDLKISSAAFIKINNVTNGSHRE